MGGDTIFVSATCSRLNNGRARRPEGVTMAMTTNDPVPDDKTQELIGLHSDLVSAAARLQRVLESRGVYLKTRVVTSRERRNLTRRQTKSKL